MIISACVIVRDGIKTLPRLCASIQDCVDEICVLDTGSRDGTTTTLETMRASLVCPLTIAGAKWSDDYGVARNISIDLVHPGSDYVIWFDDDEFLIGGPALRAAVERDRPDVVFVSRVEEWPNAPRLWCYKPRLWRRGCGAVWEGRVHERPRFARLDRAAVQVTPPSVAVLHRPVPASGRHSHRRLVELAARESPSRHTLVYLARFLIFEDRDYAEGIAALRQALDPAEAWIDDDLEELFTALGYLAYAEEALGNGEDARRALERRGSIERRLLAHPIYGRCRRFVASCPTTVSDQVP